MIKRESATIRTIVCAYLEIARRSIEQDQVDAWERYCNYLIHKASEDPSIINFINHEVLITRGHHQGKKCGQIRKIAASRR